MKACIGFCDIKQTVYFEPIKLSDIQVCTTKDGTQWRLIKDVMIEHIRKPTKDQPQPKVQSWKPDLIASYTVNKKLSKSIKLYINQPVIGQQPPGWLPHP